MEAGRPNIQFDPIVLDVYNSKIQMAGKHTWQPVSLMLRDDINGNVQKSVGEQLQKQFDFFEQASAATGQDYKFTQRIEVLDGGNGANTPAVLETWELYGCYLTNVDYGSMNYSTQDPMTVSLTIQYDNAVQLNVGVGVPNNFQDRNTETGTGATGGAAL